ncbi:MAG: lipid-A-disaccharide synthase [Proteobacteria bacterium]|nr:lipid-A-disaccharide synthase [Pseudomonadota bacterium]
MRIGIVAGENSGDLIAAQLIKTIHKTHPDIIFEGIAGPAMIAEGCEALFSMNELSVMGIIEVVPKIPRILSIRKKLFEYFKSNPPDIFIGVDAPDFNLTLELKLKKIGIKTVHYISPSVWAWKSYRIKKIKKAVDLMLTVFPFEADFYHKHQVPVCFIGHPFADQIPLEANRTMARIELGLDEERPTLALLPGSRSQELKYLSEDFIKTAEACLKKIPNLQLVTAMIDEHKGAMFQEVLKQVAPHLPIKIFYRQSQKVMTASDVILLASGTATLEAMLLKRPMVVAYRLSFISFAILERLVNLTHVALPNLLASEPLVPEYLQDDATVENLTTAVLKRFEDKQLVSKTLDEFVKVHQALRQGANEKAAEAVLSLL